MIGVRCDRCGAHFWAKDEAAGRSATCSRCGQILRVPEPPEEDEAVSPRRADRDQSPRPEPSEPPSPRLTHVPASDDADPLRAILRTARQIRFLLVMLIALGLILLGLLVMLSARVFVVRVVN